MKKQPIPTSHRISLEETLFAFRRKLSDILQKEAEDLQCPVSQIDTLVYIAEKVNPTMKEIADHLKITPPSATSIIEIMRKKKFITRVVNNKNRRTIRVALTPKAWAFFKSFRERKFTTLTKMFSRLHGTEQKQLIRILNILIKE
jgi:DNA-binding MarR family transcriptional regulator